MEMTTNQEAKMTPQTTINTGDLELARGIMSEDSFLDGRTGLNPEEYVEYYGDDAKAPSESGTVSIYLNGEVVESLLKMRGWTFEARFPQTSRAWHAPDGESFCWGRDEALGLALTAEVL